MMREKDVAGSVHDLRACGRKVTFGLKSRPAYWNITLLDLAIVTLPRAKLRTLDVRPATTMADSFEKLASELQSDPPMLAEPELLMHRLGAEIGNQIVQSNPAIDSLAPPNGAGTKTCRLSVGHCHGQPTMAEMKRRKKARRDRRFLLT